MDWSQRTRLLDPAHLLGRRRRGSTTTTAFNEIRPSTKKLFGIFQPPPDKPANHPIVRGFDERLLRRRHSRHTDGPRRGDRPTVPELEILASSKRRCRASYIVGRRDGRHALRHRALRVRPRHPLASEYFRDQAKGLAHPRPRQLLPPRRPRSSSPPNAWRGHANLLYSQLAQLLRLPEHAVRPRRALIRQRDMRILIPWDFPAGFFLREKLYA